MKFRIERFKVAACGTQNATAKPSVEEIQDRGVVFQCTSILLEHLKNGERVKHGNTPLLTSPIKGRKCAFTLAETLITLVIIGVVAALTVPSLMNKTNMQEYKSSLKVAYSQLLQAYNAISRDNGNFKSGMENCIGSRHVCIKNLFKERFNNVKDCTEISEGCFTTQENVKFLNGQQANSMYFNNNMEAGLILSNGIALSFYSDNTYCTGDASQDYNNRCGFIVVDVNGAKKPNTWGKDIYLFFVFSDTIRPSIANSTCDMASIDDCFADKRGFTCSSKYLFNGE